MRAGRRGIRSSAAVAAAVLIAGLLGACAEDDGPAATGVGAEGDALVEAEVAWTHLGVAESTLPGLEAAATITDADGLAEAWDEHDFQGEPPAVGFEDHVVLLLGVPDDACPDELIGLEVADGELVAEWLPPPGACEQPLILWLHAVQVHRGVLAESFMYGPSPPFEDELAPVTLELPPYDGVAPPAPEPPTGMDPGHLDEVFADHPVQRCGPEHRLGRGGEVDGPLSDDPDVAAAQQGRAEHGLPSDEETTRTVMADPDVLPEYGFPMLPEEQELDMDAGRVLEEAVQVLEANGWDLARRMPGDGDDARGVVVPMIDRSDGIHATVVVGADEEEVVRDLLDREVGAGEVAVVVSPWDPARIVEAQDAVTQLMMDSAGGAGAISWVSGPPGPATIGMIDPTRDALDRVAEVVDPELVCVDVELSGVQPADG